MSERRDWHTTTSDDRSFKSALPDSTGSRVKKPFTRSLRDSKQQAPVGLALIVYPYPSGVLARRIFSTAAEPKYVVDLCHHVHERLCAERRSGVDQEAPPPSCVWDAHPSCVWDPRGPYQSRQRFTRAASNSTPGADNRKIREPRNTRQPFVERQPFSKSASHSPPSTTLGSPQKCWCSYDAQGGCRR